MKTSDVGVVVVVYGIAIWFFAMTLGLPESTQTYPLILLAALCAVNTAFLLRRVLEWVKSKKFENDVPELFSGFLWRQFFGVCAGCVAYLALLNYLGYNLTSVAYLLLAQFALKVRAVPAIVSCACIMVVVYFVFTQFLKVPLPVGVLFGG